ncbi:MAG: hypothetical protein OHK0029_15310 [Armatimonadaceae bacterium]
MSAHLPTDLPDLVSFWDFAEDTGAERVARGPYPYRLRDANPKQPVRRVTEGVFGSRAAHFRPGQALYIPRAECPALNLHGPNAQVSVVAWVKREPSPHAWACQAVAGMWNEHGKRQYCLFLNLRIWESGEQVGAHVSSVGGPTPGFKYCMDAAIGATPVSLGEWHCLAMTYDGTTACAYLDGTLDHRGKRNPYHYPGGLFDGGPDGSDFTVGAVLRPEKVTDDLQEQGSILGNPFYGLLGGLAVYRRALTPKEIASLAAHSPPAHR